MARRLLEPSAAHRLLPTEISPRGTPPPPGSLPAPPEAEPRHPIAPAAYEAVARLVGRARRRQRNLYIAEALGWSLAAFAALAPLVFALGAKEWGLARWLFWALLGGSAGAFVFFGPLRSRFGLGSDEAVARLLAQREPMLRRDLLSAVQLHRELVVPLGEPRYSEALVVAHLQRTSAEVPGADLSKSLPALPALRAWTGTLLALLSLLAFLTLAPEALRRGAAFIFASAAKGGPGLLGAPEPVTGEIELSYSYPAHTGLAPKTVPGTNGEISAPAGTEVRLKTRADRELAKAWALYGEVAIPLSVSGGRNLEGQLIVEKPGSYRFRFADARGKVLVEGPPIPVAVEMDAAPKVSLLAPTSEVEVGPKDRVTLRYEAEDDYGLSELALVYKLPGSAREERKALSLGRDARRSAGDYAWDMATLNLSPGDRVAYFIEATDNDAVSGKKKGTSRTQYLKVFSEAEHHRELIGRIEKLWDKLVDLLADRMEGPDRAEKKEPKLVSSAAMVDDRALMLADEMRSLGRDIRQDRRAPPELGNALSNVATELRRRASFTADARGDYLRQGRLETRDPSPGRRLTAAVGAEIGEEEKDVLYLERLLDRRRMQDLISLGKELSAKRRELQGLLEQFAKAPDKATQEKIESEIARLKERMRDLLSRMAELGKGLRDENLNAEALAELSKSHDMMGALDKVQELLNQGKADEALAELQKLGQSLDQMMGQLAKAGKGMKGGEMEQLGQELGEFARDLDELIGDQQALAQDTQEVRAAYKKGLSERLGKKGSDFAEKLRSKVQKALEKVKEIPPRASGRFDDELRGAEESLQTLDQALAVKDFSTAAEAADAALRHAEDLSQRLGQEYQDYSRFSSMFPSQAANLGELQAGQKKAEQALPPIREVKEQLDSLFPPPNQMLSEQDKERMKGIGDKQAGLKGRAQKLGEKMEALGQKVPIFPQEAKGQMRGAGQSMGEAMEQARARNPTGALARERQAIEHLGKLKKGLEEAAKQGGEGGIPLPLSMGESEGQGENGSSDPRAAEKVEIPGAEQYRVPEEFRKDILDAMKQGSPDRYREQVKRYYEEIVK